MSPFEPAGDRARWRILYELLTRKGLEDEVTYEEMGKLLDLDPDGDRHAIQMAFRRAAKQYEQMDNRAVEAVPNVGYRIVIPGDHLRLAKAHKKKSGKSLERGHSKVVHVDLAGMEPEVRKAFEVTARAFSVLMDYSRRLDARQDRLEAALDSMTNRTSRTEEEVAELKARLARLEERQGEL